MYIELTNDVALLERLVAEHGPDILVRLTAAGFVTDMADMLEQDSDLTAGDNLEEALDYLIAEREELEIWAEGLIDNAYDRLNPPQKD